MLYFKQILDGFNYSGRIVYRRFPVTSIVHYLANATGTKMTFGAIRLQNGIIIYVSTVCTCSICLLDLYLHVVAFFFFFFFFFVLLFFQRICGGQEF